MARGTVNQFAADSVVAFAALVALVAFAALTAPNGRQLMAEDTGEGDYPRVNLGESLNCQIPIINNELPTVMLDAANRKVYRFRSHLISHDFNMGDRYNIDAVVQVDIDTGKSQEVFDARRLWEREWAGFLGQLDDGRLVLSFWFPDLSWTEPNLEKCRAYYQTLALVDPSDGSMSYRTLDLYDSSFHSFGHKELVNDWFIVSCRYHAALLAPDGSRYFVDLEKLKPTFVGYGDAPSIIPLDLGTTPLFLVIDEVYGFRVLDADGALLHQYGSVQALMPAVQASPEGKKVYAADLLRARRSLSVTPAVVYLRASYPKLDRELGLVVFYDYGCGVVAVASPLGEEYKRIVVPEELWIEERKESGKPRPWDEYWDPTVVRRNVIDAGLTGEDGYMLLFEDGTTFTADYSDIADQVRRGELDPLGPLRELMGLEKDEE